MSQQTEFQQQLTYLNERKRKMGSLGQKKGARTDSEKVEKIMVVERRSQSPRTKKNKLSASYC